MGAFQVETHYLGEELIRVEFAASHIVSDHPVKFGGHGKGPSPGEFLMASLASATLFAMRKDSIEEQADIGAIVRCGLTVDAEGADGPLGALSIISRLSRRIEAAGSALADDMACLQDNLGLFGAISNGVEIKESLSVVSGGKRASRGGWTNMTLLEGATQAGKLKPGEIRAGEYSGWRVNAAEVQHGLALLQLSGAPILVSDDGRGGTVTPTELLLAALATCTTIFVARNARFQDIPVDHVKVTVTSEGCEPGQPLRIEKHTQVTGDLSASDTEKCTYFANRCAVGESLTRGIEIVSEVAPLDMNQASPSIGQPSSAIPGLLSSVDQCSDMSCCVA